MEILNPDFFEEEPNMFLGDHDAYFKIVKKRSIFFFYLSRVILYLLIIFLILQFIERDPGELDNLERGVYSKTKLTVVMIF